MSCTFADSYLENAMLDQMSSKEAYQKAVKFCRRDEIGVEERKYIEGVLALMKVELEGSRVAAKDAAETAELWEKRFNSARADAVKGSAKFAKNLAKKDEEAKLLKAEIAELKAKMAS